MTPSTRRLANKPKQADPGWPAVPTHSLSPDAHSSPGEWVEFTDGTKRQILKIEQTQVSNRPGDSGANHIGYVTTILFEPNPQRWIKP